MATNGGKPAGQVGCFKFLLILPLVLGSLYLRFNLATHFWLHKEASSIVSEHYRIHNLKEAVVQFDESARKLADFRSRCRELGLAILIGEATSSDARDVRSSFDQLCDALNSASDLSIHHDEDRWHEVEGLQGFIIELRDECNTIRILLNRSDENKKYDDKHAETIVQKELSEVGLRFFNSANAFLDKFNALRHRD